VAERVAYDPDGDMVYVCELLPDHSGGIRWGTRYHGLREGAVRHVDYDGFMPWERPAAPAVPAEHVVENAPTKLPAARDRERIVRHRPVGAPPTPLPKGPDRPGDRLNTAVLERLRNLHHEDANAEDGVAGTWARSALRSRDPQNGRGRRSVGEHRSIPPPLSRR
jgi:hypothetical protein